MTKKILTITLSLVFCLVIFGLTINVIADDGKAPDEITLTPDICKTPKKGPVLLTHKKHAEDYKINCNECHHVYKDGKNIWKKGDAVQKCSECHDLTVSRKELKEMGPDAKMKHFATAFHNNCKKCHKKNKKEGGKAPTSCKDCHAMK